MSTESPTATELERPARDWEGFFKRHFGPSMLWALISIGGSHIVLGPTMGSIFGLFALWIFGVIYVAKYGAWELGIRYNYGVGGNPVEAYDQLPGPKNWMQWYTIVVFAVFYLFITGAVGMSAAALITPILPLTFPQTFVALIVIAGALVFVARYSLLEKILMVFTVALGILIVLGAVVGPPPADVAFETALSIDLSGERIIIFVALFAAAAGFAPTGFSTSVLIGSWSMAKGEGAGELRERGLDPEDDQYHDYIADWIATGRRDFNLGYVFSFVLVAAMIILASNVLYPQPVEDENFAFALGQILSESFGPWSFWAIIIGGFAALYSTVITLVDGASRATSDILPMAAERPELDKELVRRLIIGVFVLVPTALVLTLGSIPVTFIVAIAAVLAATEILFYPANWYVVKKNLPESFQPSQKWVAYYVISLVVVIFFGVLGAIEQFDLVPDLVQLLS